jgi:Domain of unknown function (DUF4412)
VWARATKIAPFHLQFTLLVLAAAVAHAGFRFTDENGAQSLVSKGRFKQAYGSAAQSQSMIDMQSGQMWMSNAERKVYWQGTVDEFCGQIKHAASAMQDAVRKGMEEQMTKMSPGQRAKMAEAMKRFGALGDREEKPEAAREPEVTVERTDDTATIAGQPTLKYRVLSDGEVQGEYWITTDPAIAREFVLDRAAATMGRFRSCQSASRSPGGGGLEQVFSQGFPLKTRTYVSGKPVASRVYTKVEKIEIPDVEFSPPASFRRVAIRETMFPGIQSAPASGGGGE